MFLYELQKWAKQNNYTASMKQIQHNKYVIYVNTGLNSLGLSLSGEELDEADTTPQKYLQQIEDIISCKQNSK